MTQKTFGEHHRPDSTFNYLKNASYRVRFLLKRLSALFAYCLGIKVECLRKFKKQCFHFTVSEQDNKQLYML